MAGMSPTQLTLRQLKKEGYLSQTVEHWNSFARVRQDLFNVIDVVALGDGVILGVQATSASNHSARVKKICAHENTAAILKSGMSLEVWSWRKVKNRWQHRVEKISVEGLTTDK